MLLRCRCTVFSRRNSAYSLAWTSGYMIGPAIVGFALAADQGRVLFAGLIAALGVVAVGAWRLGSPPRSERIRSARVVGRVRREVRYGDGVLDGLPTCVYVTAAPRSEAVGLLGGGGEAHDGLPVAVATMTLWGPASGLCSTKLQPASRSQPRTSSTL